MKTTKLKPIAKPANLATELTKPKKGAIGNFGGVSTLPNIKSYTRPSKPIILYEFEGNADCKRVREACSILDVSMDIRPCPGATSGWSDVQSTLTKGGLRTVPFMIDNNPSMIKPQLTGADDIIKHLFATYGPGADKIPGNLKGGGLFAGSGKGGKLRKNARPDFRSIKPLTLYGYEGVGAVKSVREVLTDLGLAHTYIVCANGSANK